ncbi:MAG TPA: alpha/beta hydrolase [Sphingomonadaceae bacterium]|nr:alpha/beta hydrolase [Sphingomonadaceae bacterium]
MSSNLHQAVIDTVPPPFSLLWREAQAFADVRRFIGEPEDLGQRGDGAPVVVIPGFLATDNATQRLRRALDLAGYRPFGWGQGRNFGATAERLDALVAHVAGIATCEGRPVALVGWSLGGLYAREVAKRIPTHVARVVTMGSPFSGDPRANHAWRLYEWVNRHPVDRPPVVCDLSEKPPVPTIAIWSRGDGVVAPASARGLPHEVDKAIELGCTHIGFTSADEAIAAVLDALEDD